VGASYPAPPERHGKTWEKNWIMIMTRID